MAENDHALIPNIDVGVVVVADLLIRDAIADKGERQVELAATASGEGGEIFFKLQVHHAIRFFGVRRWHEPESVALRRANRRLGSDGEILKGSLGNDRRFQADLCEFFGDILGGPIQARGSNSAPLHGIVRQYAD